MDGTHLGRDRADGSYATLPFPVPRAAVASPLRLVVDDAGAIRDERSPSGQSPSQRPRVGEAGAAVARLRREAGPPDAVRAVVRENRLAAGLNADDARLMLAQRVAESLEGGRAAILTPERRRRALRMARLMGLRPFDASLVVAVVQDSARAGLPHALLAADPRLALVAPSDPSRRIARRRLFVSARLVSALLVAAAVFGALVSWALR